MSDLLQNCVTALLAQAVILLLASSAEAEHCALSGFQVVFAARDVGWTVSAQKVEGDGSCLVKLPGVLVAASQEGDGLVCRAVFFQGGHLAEGWEVTRIKFAGPQLSELERDQWPSHNMRLRAEVSVPSGTTRTIRIRQVYLSGPSCSDWKKALVPPQ